jgi:hypothetical protein
VVVGGDFGFREDLRGDGEGFGGAVRRWKNGGGGGGGNVT